MLFILLNPQTGTFAMFPLKDIAFGMGAFLLMCFCIRIYLTRGKWLDSFVNALFFVIVVVLTTLFRHNAVLFTAPALLAVVFWLRRKKAVIICISTLLLFVAVKGPVYHLLGVESPDRRQIETLGLPMTVIGAVVHDNPESLPDEVKKFVYSIAPEEVWQKEYVSGDYNAMKWDTRTNNDVIEQYGALAVLRIMIQCVKAEPISAIKGLIRLTDPLYSLTHLSYGYSYPTIMDNTLGISEHGIGALQMIVRYYGNVGKLFPHLFSCLGLLHFIILVAALTHLKSNRLKNWKSLLFALPVFCYNFGTMLLLTGSRDAGRFFYYTFLLFPLMMVFYLGNKDESKTIKAD